MATNPSPRSVTGIAAAGVAVALVVLQVVLGGRPFPESWSLGVAERLNRIQSWVVTNRTDHWIFTVFFRPVADGVGWCYDSLLGLAEGLPWFWLPLVVLVIVLRSGSTGGAVFAAGGLVLAEFVGLHDPMMQTITISVLCVLLCLVIGGPLGVWTALRPGTDRWLRPVVDVLQSLPVSLYLLPAVLFFKIGAVPAIIATVAFAVGPLIRITALGIREVPQASVEAGEMFGSTRSQLLWKVRIPQAMPTILTGVNQTVMAALSMAVIGAFVGAGGLGAAVLETLRLRSPGRGLLVGSAIVAIAIAFDRVIRSLVARPVRPQLVGGRFWGPFAAGALVLGFVGRLAGAETPLTIDRGVAEPVDRFVIWVRDTFDSPLQRVNDLVVGDIAVPVRTFVGETLAWPVLVLAVAALLAWLKGWRVGAVAGAGVVAIGLLGVWAPTAETFAQLLIALVLSVVVAIPFGIFVGTRPRLEAAVNPVMESLQTLPSMIYTIPFVMIFAVGYLPGILATALYAIPAGARLAAMAIRNVDPQALEASTTFGATPWQRMWRVRIPMAFDGIMLGANQLIMMAMSMVLITGQFGAQGLGYLLVSGLTKPDIGAGLEAGIAVVILGVLIDRVVGGFGGRLSPLRHGDGRS